MAKRKKSPVEKAKAAAAKRRKLNPLDKEKLKAMGNAMLTRRGA